MREIKFRAWEEELKLMLMPVDLSSPLQEYKWLGRTDLPIMQYTGLKDKNGKEIYEGDITKHKYWEGKDIYVVIKWDDGLLTFKGNVYSERDGIECENVFFIDSDNHKFEIIGDIYSNPELLSKDK